MSSERIVIRESSSSCEKKRVKFSWNRKTDAVLQSIENSSFYSRQLSNIQQASNIKTWYCRKFFSSPVWCVHYDFILSIWITLRNSRWLLTTALHTFFSLTLIRTNGAYSKNRTRFGHELQSKWSRNVLWDWFYCSTGKREHKQYMQQQQQQKQQH